MDVVEMRQDLRLYIDDRPDEGVFRVHRDIYIDPAIFEMEMKLIFERTWNFLAHASEIPKAHDFVTRHIGRTPVMVSRDAKGTIGAFINACRHKGATVCRLEQGNAKYHVCPYHGWAYDSAGKNVDIKDRSAGCYAPAFDQENHDLLPIAKLGDYKGMIFGSLSPEAPSLDQYLGEMKPFLDLHLEQGPQGVEVIPGRALYTYRGNWKMQMENALDPYHVTSTHACLADLQARRRKGVGNMAADRQDWSARARLEGGAHEFRYGHCATWTTIAQPEKRPIWPVVEELRARVGSVAADWMFYQRNAVLFPNLQVSDAVAPMWRTFRPVAVDLTELRTYVIAPVGEKPELRSWRLRQFEDSINPGGFATPDDVTMYTECQRGYQSAPLSWLQAHQRGLGALHAGADQRARELGMAPLASVNGPKDQQPETGIYAPMREWRRLMSAGAGGER